MPDPIKSFNNVILGQYVLTGVPIKVYVNGRYLTLTDPDDVEDPTIGFGMDENGQMIQFSYIEVEKLLISGNEVTLDTYNQGMGASEETPKEEPAEEDPKKEESIMKLKSLAELTKAEFQAQMKSIDVSKKALLDKERDLKTQPIEDSVVTEYHGTYTFGTGDIVKNINPDCPHFGSMGVIQKMMNIPLKGKVAIYTVTNNGPTYKPGDKLTKTVDQLEPVDLGTVKMDDED